VKNISVIICVISINLCNLCYAQDYWQQEVNYKIDVRLDDQKHELLAEETIEYINNSPDELTEIYMHLWPNAYKDNSTALAKQKLENGSTKLYYAEEEDRGFIDQLDFKVNGQTVKWGYDTEHIDICKIILNEPLRSGERLTISTPFHVKVPKGIFSRLGHIGESYQITQWYPKPAVYDAHGWNQMPYLDQGEFYSEFGSFDVSITLPKNYVVGATGDMVNGEAELKWLEEKVKATEEHFKKGESGDANIEDKQGRNRGRFGNRNKEDIDNISFPPSDLEMKTLRFKQSNVHDFAWFADKRWHVLKGEVELPHSKRKVDTWVMFTDAEADLWKNAIEYINDAVYYFSLWNGDYPYNHATAVDGALSAGGGMEYPNITVIGSSGSAFALEHVIVHEVGHNWFYGILGSNEREHPWMDEGINSFNDNRYTETKHPDRKLLGDGADTKLARKLDITDYKHKAMYYFGYLLNARRNLDQPIEYPAPDYTQLNYGGMVYFKTALAFDYLMAYLGEETMDKAMQKYYDTWKFKHPQPNDLRKILEEVSGKDLSWFFDDMINTAKKLDYKIVKATMIDQSINIKVKNTGDIKGPFSISGIKDGVVIDEIWYDGFGGEEEFSFSPGEYDSYRIDSRLDMPEISRKNNTLKAKGVFKRVEPVKFQFLGSLENPDKTQLFYLPVMGWNNYNKTMLGIAFYNSLIPQKKFEYVFVPLYSFGTNEIAGSANIAYNMYPGGDLFQNIRLSVSASQYAFAKRDDLSLNYIKLTPKIDIEFKKKNARSPIRHTLSFRNVNIAEEQTLFSVIYDTYIKYNSPYYVNDLSYQLNSNRTMNPYNCTINIQQAKDFVKTSLEMNYRISYKGRNKGLDIRFFTGKSKSQINGSKVPHAKIMSGLMLLVCSINNCLS